MCRFRVRALLVSFEEYVMKDNMVNNKFLLANMYAIGSVVSPSGLTATVFFGLAVAWLIASIFDR